MNSLGVLSEQYKLGAALGRTSIHLRALQAFAQSTSSNNDQLHELAGYRRFWGQNSRQPALLRFARSTDLAEGSSHFLVPRFSWFSPTEPQATLAFVELLAAGDRSFRLARGLALWEAALQAQDFAVGAIGYDAKPQSFDFPPTINAEHGTDDGKRIDILLEGEMQGETVELVIEAKLGHHLTDEQLAEYTKDSRRADGKRQLLLVLAPKLTKGDAKLILKENRREENQANWRFATWRKFLIDYSCALAPEYDDEEFRRLRRSLADHAAKWE